MSGPYREYTVVKNSDLSLVDRCFVLRPDTDEAASVALAAYADAVERTDPQLATDLRSAYVLPQTKPQQGVLTRCVRCRAGTRNADDRQLCPHCAAFIDRG